MRRAVTPVIAIILLVLMTVSASGVAFIWISSVQSGIQETVGGEISGSVSGNARLNLISMRGDGVTVQNVGSETINNVTVVVDGVLTNYDLSTPLAPGEAGTILFEDVLEEGLDHSVQIVISNSESGVSGGTPISIFVDDNDASTDAGYGVECSIDDDCTGEEICCDNSCLIPTCSSNDDCSPGYECVNGGTCTAECVVASCSESSCASTGIFFSGTIVSSDYAYCACCGDDTYNDIFYNSTHSCASGNIIYDNDNLYTFDYLGDKMSDYSAKSICELKGYDWISYENLTMSFDNYTIGNMDASITGFSIADLDNDGDIDFITGDNGDGDIFVWQNDGTPFEAWSSMSIGNLVYNPINSLIIGDIDNDGYVDVIAGISSGIYIWLNDGTPFTGDWDGSYAIGSAASTINALGLVDVDNNGWLDIITGDADTELHVFQNDEGVMGSWNSNLIGYASNNVKRLIIADFDNDGYVDIASLPENAVSDYDVEVWQNDGTPFTGTWTGNSVVTPSNPDGALSAADFDNNGFIDLVYADSETVYVSNNDGTPFTGTWSSSSLAMTNTTVYTVSVCDLNNDGYADVVSGNGDADFGIFENPTTTFGAWESWNYYWKGNVDLDILFTSCLDADNDGDLDVVYTDANSLGNLGLWKNNYLTGSNGPCCETGDTFSNSTHSCCNGVYQEGSC